MSSHTCYASKTTWNFCILTSNTYLSPTIQGKERIFIVRHLYFMIKIIGSGGGLLRGAANYLRGHTTDQPD